MSEAKDVIRVGLMILLGVVVLAVSVPLVLAAAGIVIGFLFHVAVVLIKVSVVLAILYLILVAVRSLLR